ncbi:MAG: Trm112 family protein [Pseudomonadota bacterium]
MSAEDDANGPAPRASGMDPRVLELLICPLTRQPLEYDRDANELVSRTAGLAFPIRNGLPLLIEKHARYIGDKAP